MKGRVSSAGCRLRVALHCWVPCATLRPFRPTRHPSRSPDTRAASAARRARGVTLVELLIVMGIIIILLGLLVPSMKTISGATNLTAVTEEFAGQVNFARQRSSTFNRAVAIRFWRAATSGPYTSYQIWEQVDSANPASWQPAAPERLLPAGIGVDDNATNSSLLTRFSGAGKAFTEQPPDSRDCADIVFTPAGSVVASSTQRTVAFIPNPKPSTVGMVNGLPPNFGIVDIQPMNAIPTVYRPQ